MYIHCCELKITIILILFSSLLRECTCPGWQMKLLWWKVKYLSDSDCHHQVLLKGAQSRFAHFEKLSLNFSNLSFAIRVNLCHPWPSLFLYSLLLSLWCFSILVNYYFQISFHLKEILYMAKKRTKYCDWVPLNISY